MEWREDIQGKFYKNIERLEFCFFFFFFFFFFSFFQPCVHNFFALLRLSTACEVPTSPLSRTKCSPGKSLGLEAANSGVQFSIFKKYKQKTPTEISHSSSPPRPNTSILLEGTKFHILSLIVTGFLSNPEPTIKQKLCSYQSFFWQYFWDVWGCID